MKKAFLLLIALTIQGAAFAQLPGWYKNLEKYWWYRYRLVNDFMKIGTNAGESIPATTRSTSQNGYTETKFNPDVNTNNELKWHDATLALGHYIAMLATEYRQLANNGRATARTEYELQRALDAFDRLDANAETYCYNMSNNIYPGSYPGTFSPNYSGYPPSMNKNGFFIRDDVPYYDFVENNKKHFNRPGLIDYQVDQQFHEANHADAAFLGRYEGPLPGGATAVRDDTWPSAGTPRYPTEESQDQIVDLFLGMALTNKLVGNGSLKSQATDALYRMIKVPMDGSPQFRIRNPLTTKCVYGVSADAYATATHCNKGGADFLFSCVPATKANRMIAGSYNPINYLPLSAAWEQTAFASYDYAFQFHQFLNATPSGSPYGGFGVYDIYFNDVFVAFARNWLLGQGIPINTSWPRIVEHARSNYFSFPHTPLIYKLNYPGGGAGWAPQNFTAENGDQLPSYESLLNLAPTCGIYNYNGAYGSKEWNGDDRLSDARHRKDIGAFGENGQGNADYCGLDYMLLFNLYGLVQGNYMQGLMNSYYRENYNVNYPESNGMGSTTKKLTLNFLEYFSAINKINSGGYVTFRGAKQVELLPGFEAKTGSVTNVYVKDFNFACNNPSAGDYHYAYLTTPIQYMSRGAAADSTDTAEITEPITYLPDGDGYMPQTDTADYGAEDSAAMTMITPQTDSLLRAEAWQRVLDANDSDVINYYLSIPGFVPPGSGSGTPPRKAATGNGNNTAPVLNAIVFPNPSSGNFTVGVNIPGNYLVKVLNPLGVTIAETRMTGEMMKTISLNNVPPGCYVVDITGNDCRIVKRVTIAR